MNGKLIITGILTAATYSPSVLAAAENDPNIGRPNPVEIVADIVAEQDANADNLMNATELEAANAGIHEKRKEKFESLFEERCGDREGQRFGDQRGACRGPPLASEVASWLTENLNANGDEQLDTEEIRGAVRALKLKVPSGMRGRPHHLAYIERTPLSSADVE